MAASALAALLVIVSTILTTGLWLVLLATFAGSFGVVRQKMQAGQ